MCQFDESYELSYAPPPPPRSPASEEPPETAPNPGAVQQLVSAAPPQASHVCLSETADVVKAGGQMLVAAAAVLGSAPTLAGLAVTGAAYLGASAVFGASLAKLENCQDEAAAKVKAQ